MRREKGPGFRVGTASGNARNGMKRVKAQRTRGKTIRTCPMRAVAEGKRVAHSAFNLVWTIHPG
jgi:hypothetical protein